MPKLTKRQIDQLTGLLDQREQEVRAEIRSELESSEDFTQVAGEAPDTGDVSLADLVVHLGNAAVTRHITELREIEAARGRIADTTYGICQGCGGGIPLQRLQAQPTAQRCMPCQDHYEKTHVDAGKRSSY